MAFQLDDSLVKNSSLLRRHKILPRRTPGQWPEASYLYSPSTSSLESIISTPQHSSIVPDLPPTPPSNRTSDSPTTALLTNAPTTPHRSPPTPDNTPPRQSTADSHLKPPRSLRHSISVTDSFRTAVEEQDEPEEDTLVRRMNGVIGLGLGLESEYNTSPRTPRVIQAKGPSYTDTIGFDGNWGQNLIELGQDDVISDAEWAAKSSRNAGMHEDLHDRLRRSLLQPSLSSSPDLLVADMVVETPKVTRGLSLRQRIQNKKGARETDSTENFGASIDWPANRTDSPESLERFDVDVKRFSGISSSSTIVREAVVLDSLPQRQPTLRHTRKTVQLRRGIDPDLFRNGDGSSKKQRSFSYDLDRTYSMDESDNIPVMVIPERQSSLRRKAAFTLDRHLRSESIRHRHAEARKRRTVSDTIKYDDQTTVDYAPIIPQRSSSLSAPTSRVHSRAASMTSATIEISHTKPELAIPPSDDTPGNYRPVSSHVRSPSTPEALEISQARAVNFYPHSNHSINLVIQSNSRPQTSAAAPTNQVAPTTVVTTKEIEPLTPPTQPFISEIDSPLKNPRTPPEPPQFMVIPPTPANAALSQDGGDDPRPSSSHSATRSSSPPTLRPSPSQPSGPVSRMKRALSQPGSASKRALVIRPLTLLRTMSLTTSSRPQSRPSSSSKNTNEPKPPTRSTTLHPLWRPRAFWDGFPDEAEGAFVLNEDFLDRGWTPWLDNSPGALERRFSYAADEEEYYYDENEIFNGPREGYAEPPPAKRRRSTAASWFQRLSYTEERERRHERSAWQPAPLGLRGWHAVRERVGRMRERRAKEQKREEIKGRIGEPGMIERSI